MIPPRPSKQSAPPARKRTMCITPNIAWASMDDIEAHVQIIPGAKLISVREVTRYECTIELRVDDRVTQPPLCHIARLWSFKDEKAADKFKESNCPGLPILARWKCNHCQCYHQWCTAPGDTNGGIKSGSFTISNYLRKLIDDTAIKGTIKTYER